MILNVLDAVQGRNKYRPVLGVRAFKANLMPIEYEAVNLKVVNYGTTSAPSPGRADTFAAVHD